MTRDEAVARIKEGLEFRVGTGSDAAIVSRLVEAQRHLELGRTLPNFLVQEDQVLVATAGSAAVDLPVGFIREVEGEGFHYFDVIEDEEVRLEKVSVVEARSRFMDTDPGRPIAYVLRKATMLFYPERDISYSMTWSYYKQAALLTTNIENVWLLHNPDVLIGYAGWKMALDLVNEKAAARFERLFNIAWSGGFAHDIERERDNDPVYMGGRL